ncbi:putative phage protein gp47/JayE [Fusobacterium naviforme]|nr:baseplate J/gp47 family protein [Fusobacterium naviforme]PSL10185.1 putative phage protein gp47/JayE [Fusobacterium naviforme]STO27595.1 Uncharacterized homolog of phage Mu protein gp47 [Fusobacterium naviforme]
MFEGMTYEILLEDVLSSAPDGVDTRQGSIFFDAVSGLCIKIAKLYTDLDLVLSMTSIVTAIDDALDAKASEYGIERLRATKAKYNVTFEGVTPQLGERFYSDRLYFILKEDTAAGVMYLEAEVAGTGGNNVYSGTNAVPVNTIEGLEAATFGTLYESGTDDETDDNLRTRVQEKIAGSAENGNKQHYKTWCESIEGIGRARIYPLWNGPNTVKAVLIDGTGAPCSATKVAEVQNYIDPATKGYTTVVDGRTYTVGDGLGEGVANLGAHFTAAAAISLPVNVSFKAELKSGATKEAAAQEAATAIAEYFQELVLDTDIAEDIVVRTSQVGAIISGLSTVLDYSNLKLNGSDANIRPGDDYVPTVGEVTFT